MIFIDTILIIFLFSKNTAHIDISDLDSIVNTKSADDYTSISTPIQSSDNLTISPPSSIKKLCFEMPDIQVFDVEKLKKEIESSLIQVDGLSNKLANPLSHYCNEITSRSMTKLERNADESMCLVDISTDDCIDEVRDSIEQRIKQFSIADQSISMEILESINLSLSNSSNFNTPNKITKKSVLLNSTRLVETPSILNSQIKKLNINQTMNNPNNINTTQTIENGINLNCTRIIDTENNLNATHVLGNQNILNTTQTIQNKNNLNTTQTIENKNNLNITQTIENTNNLNITQTITTSNNLNNTQIIENSNILNITNTIENNDILNLTQNIQNSEILSSASNIKIKPILNDTKLIEKDNICIGSNNIEIMLPFHSLNEPMKSSLIDSDIPPCDSSNDIVSNTQSSHNLSNLVQSTSSDIDPNISIKDYSTSSIIASVDFFSDHSLVPTSTPLTGTRTNSSKLNEEFDFMSPLNVISSTPMTSPTNNKNDKDQKLNFIPDLDLNKPEKAESSNQQSKQMPKTILKTTHNFRKPFAVKPISNATNTPLPETPTSRINPAVSVYIYFIKSCKTLIL